MTKRAVRLSETEAERLINTLRLKSTASKAVKDANALACIGSGIKALKTPLNGFQRWQGLGRLPVGKLNKTEQAYFEHLEARRLAGSILWFKAHAFNVRLADNTFYRIDFLVLESDMTLSIHEVKGGFTSEKGQMKIKLCAEILPVFRIFKATKLNQKQGGGWKIEDFSS